MPSDGEPPLVDIPKITILIPVFNDWQVVDLLVEQLDLLAQREGLPADVLLVNDGSSVPPPPEFLARTPVALHRVSVLHLRKNLGHQRALAVGFVHLFHSGTEDPII